MSAVLPIYNAEPYVGRCIESLQAQTMDELEFIFVDDCSTDGSMMPVEEWAKRDSRVRIIRNEANLGEGGSRNAGIRAAQGAYFCSLDPDDWVAPDFFELLYKEACRSGADVVKGTRVKIDEESGQELLPKIALNDRIRKELGEGKPLCLSFYYEHQSAIFRRRLFTEDTLYGTSSNACDTTFLVRIGIHAKSISFAEDARYFYLQRRDSATGSFTAKRSFAELTSLEEQVDALRDFEEQDLSREYLAQRMRSYMRTFSKALLQGGAGAEDEGSFCELLASIVRKIPNHETLYAGLPELKVVVEEGVFLPPPPHETMDETQAALARWSDYLSALASKPDRALIDHYAGLLVAYVCRSSSKP